MLTARYAGRTRLPGDSERWDSWSLHAGAAAAIGTLAARVRGGRRLGEIDLRGEHYSAAGMSREELQQAVINAALRSGKSFTLRSLPVPIIHRMQSGERLICSASQLKQVFTIDPGESPRDRYLLRGLREGPRGSNTDFWHRYLLAERSYEICRTPEKTRLGAIWRERSGSTSWTLELPPILAEPLQIFLFWLIAPTTVETD